MVDGLLTISQIPIPIRTIVDLPFDILFDIFLLLPSRDLVNLLCCCRNLYALVNQESIWRNFSALYGLHDITHFGGRSWFTVYTRLLHPYGPMLGLWAGDHAFTGGMLDVRLHAGDDKLAGGIHVDMWQFRLLQPEDLDRKSTRLNSSHSGESRMPSSA